MIRENKYYSRERGDKEKERQGPSLPNDPAHLNEKIDFPLNPNYQKPHPKSSFDVAC